MLPLTCALLLAAAVQQPPVFSSGVQFVYLDVFVTRNGRAVQGLRARNFEVRDDGVQQRIERVGVESLPLRVVLVFDTSGSLGRYRLAQLSEAAARLVRGLGPQDTVELITFDQELRLASPSSAAEVGRVLARLRSSGGTALNDALFAGLLRAGPERSLVVVFTDGEDNMSWLNEDPVVEAARRSSAVLQGVTLGTESAGSGEAPHLRMLRRASEATGGRLWTAPSAAELPDTFAAILDAMHRRYLLRFEPSAMRPGWHRLEVRLHGAKGRVATRPGYWLAP